MFFLLTLVFFAIWKQWETPNQARLHQNFKTTRSEVKAPFSEPCCHGDKLSPSPPISRIGVNTHKAGMEGLDKAKINQIILEASKGSHYYNNELKKEERVTARIKQMLAQREHITPAQLAEAERAADHEVQQLEGMGHRFFYQKGPANEYMCNSLVLLMYYIYPQ